VAVKCHVCGSVTRKPIAIPVCGDAQARIQVCSRRCRDEYLAGYVETHEGRTFRLLARPTGPGFVLALVWAVYAVVHLAGPLLRRVVPLPLLPARLGPEFFSAGVAALFVAYAVVREARWARWFSAGLAGLGIVSSVVGFAATRQLGWIVEGAAVFPAALLLSLGDPGPRRALAALALFSVYPAALAVTALTGLQAAPSSPLVERAMAESYPGRSVSDAGNRLRFTVDAGWYVLRPESTLLRHEGALFRAVRPDRGLAAFVHDRPDCSPSDPAQVDRILRGLRADGSRAGPAGDPTPRPVASDLGRGVTLFVERTGGSAHELWYVVFLPWTSGRCLEMRCGGPIAAESHIRTDCVRLGARSLSPL
jgi:hypothetical protein